MSNPSRVSAFLAYLLLVLGWLFVLLFRKEDKFAVFHVKQSIMLVIVAFVALVVWALFAWLVTFIPYAGAITAAASFALVIITMIGLFINWIVGMVRAIRSVDKPLPITGKWAKRLPIN